MSFFSKFKASTNHRLSNQSASQPVTSEVTPAAGESDKKKAAINSIFAVKKSTPNSRNGHSPAPTSGGGKAVPVRESLVPVPVKVEVKTEPTILRRLDGRPILMCRIPLR